MSDRKTKTAPLPKIRTPHDDLATEAAEWDARARTPAGFVDAPEAIPNTSRSTAVSIRIPAHLLELLKKFASREEIGYQVLIKRWLDDRLREELVQLKAAIRKESIASDLPSTQENSNAAPAFPLKDRADPDGPHLDCVSGGI